MRPRPQSLSLLIRRPGILGNRTHRGPRHAIWRAHLFRANLELDRFCVKTPLYLAYKHPRWIPYPRRLALLRSQPRSSGRFTNFVRGGLMHLEAHMT